MPQWIFWTPFAQAQMRKLDRTVAMQLFVAILGLQRGTADVKPLVGMKPYKRLRSNDYRVVYRELGDNKIEIVAVGHRSSIYSGLRTRLPGA